MRQNASTFRSPQEPSTVPRKARPLAVGTPEWSGAPASRATSASASASSLLLSAASDELAAPSATGTDSAERAVALASGRLKKPVQAVHIVPSRGRLTLNMRRLFNMLMGHAQREHRAGRMRPGGWFEIPIADLARTPGFDSRNYAHLRAVLVELASTPIMWNFMRDGAHGLGVTTLLPSSEILDPQRALPIPISESPVAEAVKAGDNGRLSGLATLRYSWGDENHALFHVLVVNPHPYVWVSLQVQSELRSSHALALYENAIRYATLGTTGRKPWQTWKKLLCGADDSIYPEFKEFNRSVIRPAVAEINATPSAPITLECVAHRRGRFVEALEFRIQERRRAALGPSEPVAIDEALVARMMTLGMSREEAEDAFALHSRSYIEGNLKVVEARVQAAAVKTPLSYLRAALAADYRDDRIKRREAAARVDAPQDASLSAAVSPAAAYPPRDALEMLRVEHERDLRQRVQVRFAALDEAARVQLERDFVEAHANRPLILKSYRTAGLEGSPTVRNMLLGWLVAESDLISEVERDFSRYVAGRISSAS